MHAKLTVHEVLNMPTIKNKVKEIREQHGLSQEALANRVGVTRQTIISLEKGSYVPSLLLAFGISEVFGLTVEQIFKKEADTNAQGYI